MLAFIWGNSRDNRWEEYKIRFKFYEMKNNPKG